MNNKNSDAAVGRRTATWAAILAGLAAPGAAIAQQPESVIVDVGPCVSLQSPGERLDCYEEQVARARSQSQVPARAPAATPPAATSPAAAVPTAPAPAAPPPAATARTVPPPATPAPSAAAPTPSASSASPPPQAARVESARVAEGTSPDRIEGTIAELRETVPNAWIITLHNGQVWRQEYPKAYRLAVGQRVRITRERRFGGGHRLTVVGMNGFIQVEQVR